MNRTVFHFALSPLFFLQLAPPGHKGPQGHRRRTARTRREQVFKNIQALKGTPANQVVPAMQFISQCAGSGVRVLPRARRE